MEDGRENGMGNDMKKRIENRVYNGIGNGEWKAGLKYWVENGALKSRWPGSQSNLI